jgi:hypothetical protein
LAATSRQIIFELLTKVDRLVVYLPSPIGGFDPLRFLLYRQETSYLVRRVSAQCRRSAEPQHPLSYLCIAPTYSFVTLPMLDRYLRMLVRPPSRALAFPCLGQKNEAGIDVMTNTSERVATNTSERATAQVFGLSLAAVFLGLMILNGISF